MELPIVNHPDYVAKINEDNKFPIKKFGALAEYLLKLSVVKKFIIPKECSVDTMKTSHSLEYINHIRNKTLDIKLQKKIGFPINESVVRRSFVATGGTVLASKLALDSKLACNTAGGSHHATFDCGAGYCVFNDVAVAANYLKNKGYAKKILIIDLDVHQGNGNSEIFKNDNNIFTFSMHCASNYPAKKSKSDIDVELNDYMEDEEYINTLHKSLKDKYQEMIIVQDKSIITVPHKHKHGGETLNLLYGRLNVILYNANGEIKKTYILDARQPTIFRLPENTFHSYKILSNYVIYLETKAGPYIRKSNFILMKK